MALPSKRSVGRRDGTRGQTQMFGHSCHFYAACAGTWESWDVPTGTGAGSGDLQVSLSVHVRPLNCTAFDDGLQQSALQCLETEDKALL